LIFGSKGKDAVKGEMSVRAKRMLTDGDRKKIVECAQQWLGAPYLIKGSDRNGIDCSHLVVNVMKEALGVKLIPWSDWLYLYLDVVPRAKLKLGDVVFFRRKERPAGRLVTHCGIYVGNGEIIHAARRGVVKVPLASIKMTIIESKEREVIVKWIDELLNRNEMPS